MRELTFRQPRRRLMLVLTLIYLVVVVTVAIINADILSDLVNDLTAGGAKGAGLIAGISVFVPLVILLLVSRQRGVLRRDADTLTVRIGRDERMIRSSEIAGYAVNEPIHTGSLRLLAADGSPLLELHPGLKEFRQVQEFVLPEATFTEAERRDVFRGRAQAVTYRRSLSSSR